MLGICASSLLLVGIDATIVNVALPAIHRSLHASLSGLQWIVDAYTMVIASLLMLSGSTGDRIGRKRVFSYGLIVFTLGSGLCAAAPSIGVLIAARVLQAVGGSMLNPVAMSIIRNVFEDPRERAQAIGIWGAVFGLSMALGPVLGGALVDTVGWRAVFLVNVPVGAIALALTTRFVPESRAEHPRRLDPIGQLLVIVGLASLVYAIIEGHTHGWTSPEIITLFCVAIVTLTLLIRWELTRREPLIEIRFFRSIPFTAASATAIATFASFGGFLFLNTLYLQDVRHLSAFHAGLYTLPVAAMLLIFAPLSGRIIGSRGTRGPLVLGGVLIVAGVVMLTGLTPHTSIAVLLVSYTLFGIGVGLVNPPITNTAISGMPPAQAGVAAAVASTSRQVGSTLGIAVLGAVAGASAAGGAINPSFAAATHPAWWIIVVMGALILVLGLVSSTARALASAERTAKQFEQAPA